MPIKFNEVTWYSKLSAVLLFLLVVPLLTFYVGREYQKTIDAISVNDSPVPAVAKSDTAPKAKGFSDPRNGTYEIDGQSMIFTNGVSAGSDSEARIFGNPVSGDINGDGLHDSVFFISQETGGTGVFFYVAAAVQKDGSYYGTKAIFLGDRIAPQNIRIENGEAIVNYATRKDSDPMTAKPSIGVSKHLKIVSGELFESSSLNQTPLTAQPKSAGNTTSNIVGYFAKGSFYWYVPDWIEGNWKMINHIENEGFTLTPINAPAGRGYSDIIVAVNPSEESYNAFALYEQQRTSTLGELVLNEVLLNKHASGMLTIQTETNTRIYHVQRKVNNQVFDRYFLDGSGGKTAYIVFSASVTEFPKFEAKIRDMVEGMGMGIPPQG